MLRHCRLVLALSALGLSACQVLDTPDRPKVTLQGGPFEHAGFVNAAYTRPGRGGTLHVYIEGDGRPWLSRTRISADPTPLRALALELMDADPAPSLYLGRPCHFGGAGRPPCEPRHWTVGRYSPAVVGSMATALADGARGFDEVVLIGYSGGGALAVLVAAVTDVHVAGLVTLAANLDTEAWSRHHGYHPLTESQNPREHLRALADVPQLHLFGSADRECPPTLFVPLLESFGIPAVTVPGFDHRCCWTEAWPAVLAMLTADPGSSAAAPAAWRGWPRAARAR